MTFGVALGGMAISKRPHAAAFRLGALATVLAALSACEPGGGGKVDESGAGLPGMAARDASADGRSDRHRVYIEEWGTAGREPDNSLTPSEKDRATRQVSTCWNKSLGDIASPESMIRLKLSMNRDGTVRRLEVLDQGKMADSPSLLVLAESAIKAVMRCTPLNLPADKYVQWQTLVVRFVAKGAK